MVFTRVFQGKMALFQGKIPLLGGKNTPFWGVKNTPFLTHFFTLFWSPKKLSFWNTKLWGPSRNPNPPIRLINKKSIDSIDQSFNFL